MRTAVEVLSSPFQNQNGSIQPVGMEYSIGLMQQELAKEHRALPVLCDANGKAIVISDGPAPFVHTAAMRPGYASTKPRRSKLMPLSSTDVSLTFFAASMKSSITRLGW